MTFEIGDKAVVPALGVGIIKEIEAIEIEPILLPGLAWRPVAEVAIIRAICHVSFRVAKRVRMQSWDIAIRGQRQVREPSRQISGWCGNVGRLCHGIRTSE